MATTSFVHHTLGLRGYRHLSTEYKSGVILHHVELPRGKRRCRGCGAPSRDLTLKGRFVRNFRVLPVGSRRQVVVLHGYEQQCRRCGRQLRKPIFFAKGKQRHLRAFERYAVDLCGIAPIKHVADHLGVGWTLLKDFFKSHLRRRLKKTSLRLVRGIAVDEFAIRKGHQYMTVVLDLDTGTILHAAEGRSADAVIPCLRRLNNRGVPLEAVVVDMWPPYLLAIRVVFPDVAIVHDPFHIVALANAAVDATHRELSRSLPAAARRALEGTRFLLLKGGDRPDDTAIPYLQRL